MTIWQTMAMGGAALGIPAIIGYLMPPGMVKKENVMIAMVASSAIAAFVVTAIPKMLATTAQARYIPSYIPSRASDELVKVD